MIVGLLHQRVIQSLSVTGIINPPTFNRNMTENNVAFVPQNAEAGITLEIKRNGTWMLKKTKSTIGSPIYGDWARVPSMYVGDGYSVMFEPTNTSGDLATIVNSAASWQVINATRQVRVSLKLTTNGAQETTYTVKVSIRNNQTSEIVVGHVYVTLSVEREP